MIKTKSGGKKTFSFMKRLRDFMSSIPTSKRLSLKDILKIFSPEIDNIILSKQNEGNTFLTGTFSIEVIKGMVFKPSAVMYFAKSINTSDNEEDNVFTVNCEIPAQMISRLTIEAIRELNIRKRIEFEITAPA